MTAHARAALVIYLPNRMEGPTFQLGANFFYHLCALIQLNVHKVNPERISQACPKIFVQNFLLSLSFRLGRILKPIWAVTRQATCNCKPQCPPTSADFLQGSSLYISTTIMWGRGGATFQNPHFLFRRRDDDPMSLKLPVSRDHHAVYVQ